MSHRQALLDTKNRVLEIATMLNRVLPDLTQAEFGLAAEAQASLLQSALLLGRLAGRMPADDPPVGATALGIDPARHERAGESLSS